MKIILQKLISIILDYPRWIIALTAFITVVMISFASQLKMNFSIEELFAINDPNVEKYFDFLEEFDREDNLILLMYECEDPFSYENLKLNKSLIEKFETIKGIDEVTGLSNLEIFTNGEDELLRSVYPYIPQSTDSLFDAKKRITSSEFVQETLISRDGKLASIAIELDESFNNHDMRERIIEKIDVYQNSVNGYGYYPVFNSSCSNDSDLIYFGISFMVSITGTNVYYYNGSYLDDWFNGHIKY